MQTRSQKSYKSSINQLKKTNYIVLRYVRSSKVFWERVVIPIILLLVSGIIYVWKSFVETD